MISALCAALAACSGEKKRETPVPEAGYMVVQAQPVSLPVMLAGRTSAYETSEVRPQVSGVIRARQFTEGAIVRQGQTLYQIDPSLYRAAADEARANVAAAEATRSAAAVKASRYAPLAKIEAISQQDYTDAAAQARQAAAQVAVGRATLETARVNLRFTRVPAPITGRIGRSLVTTGGLVTANQADPLTTIQRLDPIYVDVQQSSADILKLRQQIMAGEVARGGGAARVRLTLEDGTVYPIEGELKFTDVSVDPATGSQAIRIRFGNPRGLLLPGMFVRAALVEGTQASGLLVPQRTVGRDERGRATVMVVGKDNKAEQRILTTARTVGDAWLVTKGLNDGDRVIAEGGMMLRPGMPVKPVPFGSKPAAPPQSGQAGGQPGAAQGQPAKGQ